MHTETISYQCGKTQLKGFLAFDPKNKAPLPGIVVAHAFRGQDDFARKKAQDLADLGYVALAADLYGEGKTVNDNQQAAALMMPLFTDRALLRERIVSAYQTLSKLPQVDPKRIGAIGFCFGGLTVIELLRSGVNLRGIVSFHGLLGNKINDNVASLAPAAKTLTGAALILHGNDDPLVSHDDIRNMQDELTKAKVDWQMDIYGHTVHAFTNPEVHDYSSGLAYREKASKRAWLSMRNFFEEVFI